MIKSKQFIEMRWYSPGFIFSSIIFWFQVLPITLIAFTGHYSERWLSHGEDLYNRSALLGAFLSFTFYVFFLLGLRINIKKKSVVNSNLLVDINSFYVSYLKLFSLIFIFYSLYYFGSIGVDKISQFGSNLDNHEFRTLGWDGRNLFATMMIQIARRLLLPFAFVYFYIDFLNTNSRKSKYIFILSFIGILVASIATLDRAPFMMAFVMLVYLKLVQIKSLYKIYYFSFASLLFVIILAGSLTYIQHNINNFTIYDIFESGLNFLYNRAYLAASTVPIELSYSLFPLNEEKLYLKHSRLFFLFTGNYVGSFEDASLYIGPVGAIADIWRNLGILGIVFIAVILGRIFKWFNFVAIHMAPRLKHAFSFTVITFVFYLIFGTFFSQGVFLQLFFMILISLLAQSNFKKFSRRQN